MASTAPPVLPITTVQPIAAEAAPSAVESQSPLATPDFRAFIYRITETFRNSLAHRRPWSELADRSAFAKPESLSEAAVRFRKNYAYFRVNYLSVVVLVVAFSLLAHPFSLLLLLCLLASWLFLYLLRPSDHPLILLGRSFSDRETLGVLILFSIIVIFLTSVGSVLLSALMVGFAMICAHGAFRIPDDLFLGEQDPAATGFLYFLGGTASEPAASSIPDVAQSS